MLASLNNKHGLISIEKVMTIDRSKTIEQLEQQYWGEPSYSSYLVRTCYALRSKPLEDLRIMIGQYLYGQVHSSNLRKYLHQTL